MFKTIYYKKKTNSIAQVYFVILMHLLKRKDYLLWPSLNDTDIKN